MARFTPYDFIDMIEKHGIKYYEKEAGQLFCKGSSGEIISLFQKECSQAGVEIQRGCRIDSIKKKDRFIIATNYGVMESQSLVVAAGGLSYPKLGATEKGYGIARQFGLNVTPLRPALVPLVFKKKDLDHFGGLSGVSLKAAVSCGKVSFDGNILFTHRGLSGPAILQLSLYWERGMPITVNLMPEMDVYALFMAKRQSRMKIENLLAGYLPASFAKKWCGLCIQSKPVNRYSEKEFREIACKLQNWQIIPHGTEGYEKAEVTLGGIDTDELSSRTMEAKKAPGLYFVGEVVDVTGQLGGFNLQWAWSSGYAAGEYA
ncbi:MAG: aminoacetone oxidase family FAD-binding enzyme [Nitrospirae bacterium]|nr:aminoacetone oxidase family FAD-binding enzyme [Nitrospirota bacterium]